MNLYQKDGGWANMPEIIRQPEPFTLCLGGRGTGKTYESVKFCLENRIPFLYLRRKSSQMELVAKNEFSLIVKAGEDLGMHLTICMLSKYAAGVFHIGEDGKPVGEAVAYIYYGWNMWACSACGEEFVFTEGTPDMNEYHFCPNCGACIEES